MALSAKFVDFLTSNTFPPNNERKIQDDEKRIFIEDAKRRRGQFWPTHHYFHKQMWFEFMLHSEHCLATVLNECCWRHPWIGCCHARKNTSFHN